MSIPLTTYIKQESDFCLFLNFCLTYVLTATARTPGQYKQKYRVGPVTSGGQTRYSLDRRLGQP